MYSNINCFALPEKKKKKRKFFAGLVHPQQWVPLTHQIKLPTMGTKCMNSRPNDNVHILKVIDHMIPLL